MVLTLFNCICCPVLFLRTVMLSCKCRIETVFGEILEFIPSILLIFDGMGNLFTN